MLRLLSTSSRLDDACRAAIEAVAEVTYGSPERAWLLRELRHYDAWWGQFDQKADAEMLATAPRLRVLNTTSTGTDHIDKAYCAAHGIRILSITRDYGLLRGFTATAELAWLLLLACQRQARAATRAAHAGDWERGSTRFEGRQLAGQTLGVLGVGRLGRMVAAFGQAFQMRVLACDLRPFDLPGVTAVPFSTLLAEADALSLHVHMTPENYHLIDTQALARMKPGAVLVNTARGDLVDEAALIAALDRGHLRAYGADVVHDEWRTDMRQQALVAYAATHDNVVLTPHIGGATLESVSQSRFFSARKLALFLRTGELLTMPETPGVELILPPGTP